MKEQDGSGCSVCFPDFLEQFAGGETIPEDRANATYNSR